ncbi:hypothetical protein PRZ48_005591 [Zasmidium cellare]|uniref:Carboxylic ester hydrolase n=1 Tax=Zasmidium cellare TaxID=395010 RepID=A0ABR0ELM2_ZASCE|nr:hypothetical protein PRZ48_005591 [Zasmidium cellare]
MACSVDQDKMLSPEPIDGEAQPILSLALKLSGEDPNGEPRGIAVLGVGLSNKRLLARQENDILDLIFTVATKMPTKIWLAGAVLNLGFALASAPQVKLDAGIVHGAVCDGIETSVYRGIPYAQPPVGDLRFMPPQSFNNSFSNGVLNATQFSAGCIQASDQFAWTEPSTSEDCLTVTVYAPPGNHSSLPVKVWLHGGGNTGGSASYPLYDLCHLATDSITVAIQYRLGPLGFLALDSAGIDGNMGVKDQIAALEWVQANIGAFGGHPGKVLLFGQSSGADDAFAIASLPQAKGLVKGVVCESGGGLDLAPFETMQNVGADYAVGLICGRDDSKSVDELISTYSTLPVFSQVEGTFANPQLAGWAAGNFPNSTNMANPYLDGKLFVKQPLAVGPQVPIILGSTIEKKYPLAPNATESTIIAALTQIETLFAFKCFTYRGGQAEWDVEGELDGDGGHGESEFGGFGVDGF